MFIYLLSSTLRINTDLLFRRFIEIYRDVLVS